MYYLHIPCFSVRLNFCRGCVQKFFSIVIQFSIIPVFTRVMLEAMYRRDVWSMKL